MSHLNTNEGYDLWAYIQAEEVKHNYEKVKEYFNLINAEELNKFTKIDPTYILLHAIIKYFDHENKYPEILNSIFELKNVDPQDVNTNFRNSATGTTALMLAAVRGSLKLVKQLIYWKADPHARSNNQMTPFSFAMEHYNLEVAQFLSAYVTKEELELENLYTFQTPRDGLEESISHQPTKQKYQDLLNIIDAIELRHLIEDRTKEDTLIDNRIEEYALMNTKE